MANIFESFERLNNQLANTGISDGSVAHSPKMHVSQVTAHQKGRNVESHFQRKKSVFDKIMDVL